MKITDRRVVLKKGTWSPEEDQKLVSYINHYGIWNWCHMPKAAGLSRSGKSCRLRWMNYLRPGLKRERFSTEEIETITKMHELLGNKWSKIAAKLPGRSDNEIKNFWHTHISKCYKRDTTWPESNHCRPKRFKHKKKRVIELKSSPSHLLEESKLENTNPIIESTRFPIVESYSSSIETDSAFAENDISENFSSSETVISGINKNLFSETICFEDVQLREIYSTLFEDDSHGYQGNEWNTRKVPYASSMDDELTSFWFSIFQEANNFFY